LGAEDTKNKIAEYLAPRRKMVVATVDDEGRPIAHTVEYVPDGSTVYFMTFSASRKARNLTTRPDTAYTVDEDNDDWLKISGVQMTGRASLVTGEEREKAIRMLIERFPFLPEFPTPNMPLIGMKTTVIFRIDPVHGSYLDNSVRMGYREEVDYRDAG